MCKKSCYIIAAWGGPRRCECIPNIKDRTYLLQTHLEELSKRKSIIDSVVVVSAEDDSLGKDYLSYIDNLSKIKFLNGTPFFVFRRPNMGLSYGSYLDVLPAIINKFSYFFITEDDYIPILTNFDQILIKKIEKDKNLGFLCGYKRLVNSPKEHAALFLGIARREALLCWLNFDGQKYIENIYGIAEAKGQIGLSQEIIRSGFKIDDWTEDFSSPLFDVARNTRWYGNTKKPCIFAPTHDLKKCIEHNNKISKFIH